MRRRTKARRGDVRAQLLAAVRDQSARFAGAYAALLADLEAARPVTVPAWRLPGRPADFAMSMDDWARVDADGRASPACSPVVRP